MGTNGRSAVAGLVYEFHHAFDDITVNVTRRVLERQGFEQVLRYFYTDFLNDSGIINLLRKQYLDSGSVQEVFELYQSTRLDKKSHRYESFLAMLILTVVGAVVAGVILDAYREHKVRIHELFGRQLVNKIIRLRKSDATVRKLTSSDPSIVGEDIQAVMTAFTARTMHEKGLISLRQYASIVAFALGTSNGRLSDSLASKLDRFRRKDPDSLDLEVLMLVVDSYAKGTVLEFLSRKDITLSTETVLETAEIFKGMPASQGYAKARGLLLTANLAKTPKLIDTGATSFVLCIDSHVYSPDHIKLSLKLQVSSPVIPV